jgi:hypothetical protein
MRTASLFGWKVEELQAPDSLDTDSTLVLFSDMGATAIVGNLTGPLQRAPTVAAPITFDIGRHQRAQPSDCGDRYFHLLPLLAAMDGAQHPKPESSNRASLVAWSSSLERFGAAQLNERYRKRFRLEMDEYAWAGWMSIKILLDAVLKEGTADRCTLEKFLITGARFDGHKGVPLFFDPQSRELVQPLFAPRASGEPEAVEVQHTDTVVQRSPRAASRCRGSCA